MTSKNLPPDTAREISTLKRRVSDLERMLDRLRRLRAKTATNTFDTPFAQLDGLNEATPIAADDLTVLTPNRGALLDPTGHIFIDYADDSHGWFVFAQPGWYEIGGTARFYDEGITRPGYRRLAIWNGFPDGSFSAPLDVIQVDRAQTTTTVLSGSRMVYADQRSAGRWHLAAGHDAGQTIDVKCESFWTRFVTTGKPPPVVGSA